MKIKSLFILVIALIIFGFIFRLDFSQNVGCISMGLDRLFIYRLAFSMLSLVLFIIVLQSENIILRIGLAILELLIWLTILLLLKGGYAVGFGGTPYPEILTFDFVSLLARLILISELLKLGRMVRFKFILILIEVLVTAGVLYLKVSYFALPMHEI